MLLIVLLLVGCCEDGRQGSVGSIGPPGSNALIQASVADTSLCGNGGVIYNSGTDLNNNGVLNVSEVTSTNVICNGINAPPTSLTPVSLLAPCAHDPMHPTSLELSNPNLEVFIQMANGTVLDSYSENISGYATHFGVLSPGTYISTGYGMCTFTYNNGIITKW